jgi:hypothetical protein
MGLYTVTCSKCGIPTQWFSGSRTQLCYDCCSSPIQQSSGVATAMISYPKLNYSLGWSCPKCANIFSPFEKECVYCNKKHE